MNKTFTKRTICALLALVVALTCVSALVACNKPQEWTVADVYRHSTSPQEFTSYKQEVTLPSGWSVYTQSSSSSTSQVDANSDVGYIKPLNAFVISKKDSAGDTCLSIVRCDDSRVYFEGGMAGMMFPESAGISALRVDSGLIVVKFKNGEACVYNQNAKVVLSRTKVNGVDVNIDKAVKVLDGGLVAVGYAYDVNGYSGYTSIYRPTTSGSTSERGQLVCRVQNQDNDLSYVNGFDSKYVTVVGNEEGSYIFEIPSNADSGVKNLVAEKDKGLVKDNGEDDYYNEVTYVGNGKFFVYQDWTVDKSADYTYFDGENYYFVTRHIYTPDNQKLEEYTDNSSKIFMSITNNYYDSTKANIDTRDYLNDGFLYVTYGIDIVETEGVKIGHYDQFILDSDLNIVLSLSGNYGITAKMQDRDEVGVFDLIMSYTDDVMYVPYLPSVASYYDSNGSLIGAEQSSEDNSRRTIIAQNYSNGVAVAQATFESGSTTTTSYGAFNKYGELIIPFNYSSLTAFRGYYAIGERKNADGNTMPYLIGRDGNEVELMSDMSTPLADMAKNKNGKYSYEIGCYLFKEQIEGTWYLGVKNFNANVDKNVIMEAKMSECVLYASPSSTVDVFIFDKLTASDSSVIYTIYRLI